MRRRHLVKMVVFGLAWSVIVSLCIGQTDDESVFPEIRYFRMRPKFPMPTTSHPANLEEAKRWFKEAFYADAGGRIYEASLRFAQGHQNLRGTSSPHSLMRRKVRR
jgi:hypothetical protein